MIFHHTKIIATTYYVICENLSDFKNYCTRDHADIINYFNSLFFRERILKFINNNLA